MNALVMAMHISVSSPAKKITDTYDVYILLCYQQSKSYPVSFSGTNVISVSKLLLYQCVQEN